MNYDYRISAQKWEDDGRSYDHFVRDKLHGQSDRHNLRLRGRLTNHQAPEANTSFQGRRVSANGIFDGQRTRPKSFGPPEKGFSEVKFIIWATFSITIAEFALINFEK